MIYFADIEPANIKLSSMILDPFKREYKLNSYTGDSLTLDTVKEWGIDSFDLVIGNPPYQRGNGNKGRGNTLWDKFVRKSIQTFVKPDGLLVMVNPQGWRQYGNPCGKKILSKQLVYLNMNSTKQGQATFGCATTYDWYVLENKECYKETLVNDYHNKEFSIDLKDAAFIPNHSIDAVYALIDYENTCGFICDKGAYETRRVWMSKTRTDGYNQP